MTANKKPPTFADRLVGGNFFPSGSPLHDWWETNCRYAVEEQARFGAEVLKRVPAEPIKPEELLAWFLDLVAGRFDIVAKRFLIVIRSKALFPAYEEFLNNYMESYVAYACSTHLRVFMPESMETALRLRFMQRIEHWIAEALRQIRESEGHDRAKAQEEARAANALSQNPTPDAVTPSERRAQTVAQIIEELGILKPRMYGQSDYEQLRTEYPNFLTFRVAELRADLQLKVLNIQDHRRFYRLAQELAAAYHGRELSTLQTDWKRHKPKRYRREAIG